MNRAVVIALVAALALVGCSKDDTPTTPVTKQVEMTYSVPAGMDEVAIPAPSSAPSGGVQYDIKLYRGTNRCELRAVRMLLPKGDGSEDQDATYNMLGAVTTGYGIKNLDTDGFLAPGTPGPVPMLEVSGSNAQLELRAAGRTSMASLQGFQLVYGCPKGKLDKNVWASIRDSLHVNGFTGPLTMH